MLIQQTIERLRELRLHGMLKGLEQQSSSSEFIPLGFDERLGLLIDSEVAYRDSRGLSARLRTAKLKQQACVENFDHRKQRGVDRATLREMALCNWIPKHRNVLIVGPTGVGKTFLACAIAHKACQLGYKALYERAPRLFNVLSVARADGSYNKVLTRLSKVDLLIVDDFGLVSLTDDMSRDLLEIVDDRSEAKSTILASQLPLHSWHDTISNPTLADAILDRVVHNSYKLVLKGDSMRRKDDDQAQPMEE